MTYFGYCSSIHCHNEKRLRQPSSLGTLVLIKNIKTEGGLPIDCPYCRHALFWSKGDSKMKDERFDSSKSRERSMWAFV